MINSKILFDNLVRALKLNESADELQAIAFALLDHAGVSRTDVLTQKMVEQKMDLFQTKIERLNKNEPLQYVLNEAWFCGNKFFVDASVLIPRQETELLVEKASEFLLTLQNPTLIDIGTGSGCIAISLSLLFPNADVFAIDVSDAALRVAKENAARLGARVNFLKQDIGQVAPMKKKFNLVVSNPPYISTTEIDSIAPNVKDYEPHLALFIEGDPLQFYHQIAAFARTHLADGGLIATEINELYGEAVQSIFKINGFKNTQRHRDLMGKDRVVLAS